MNDAKNKGACGASCSDAVLGAELYRHEKTGGVYEVICNATAEATGELLVVYRNIETGARWARPAAEFNDGRFTRLVLNAKVSGASDD